MKKGSIVLYKNFLAVVLEIEGEKSLIRFCTSPATATGKKAVYNELKVRDKDVVFLHDGPFSSLDSILNYQIDNIEAKVQEAYELLLSDETTCSEPISIKELAELSIGQLSAENCFAFYKYLTGCLEFEQDEQEFKNRNIVFILRSQSQIEEIKKKRFEKEHEEEIRAEFIKRLKERKLNLPDDAKFMGEVEAFALCKMEKCKTLVEAGVSQDIQKAHKLLIDTGIWDYTKNPYPSRFGFSFSSASQSLGSMPQEERIKLDSVAYAIDSEHSTDPDDAIAWDGKYLWVHIADPASSVTPDSAIDIAARNRGTTLYIPEGASRMLSESCLEDYALGLKNPSKALSFRLLLDETANILECEILKTEITVKRLTYVQAENQKESPELKIFFDIARKNLEKRSKNNAVTVQMPEVYITVDKDTKKVSIEPEVRLESNLMIQEMMLLAGEGAARFAFKNQLPFPFVRQDTPEFPQKLPDGYAGAFARIKCMRKRSVSITPGPHAGLGLSFYSQVTSPLRRYGDLIAHQQLRAFIDKRKTLTKDEMLERVLAGDEASIAAKKASRLSDTHWKLVYLIQNPEKEFEAFCIDKRDSDFLFIIPSIDMQATIKGLKNIELNEKAMLKAVKVEISTQTVDFEVVK